MNEAISATEVVQCQPPVPENQQPVTVSAHE